MKDHYKILGIPSSASRQDIRKAHRRLAMQFHPDRNQGNAFAEARFLEIQEAYTILYDPLSRKEYDDERWLSGMGARASYAPTVTPAWLLDIARKLNDSLKQMDIHRISHQALQQYILLILADAHLGVLLQYNETGTNAAIAQEIMTAADNLEVQYISAIWERLYNIADMPTRQAMQQMLKRKEQEELRARLFPFIILLITLALCIFMYFYSK